MDRQISFSGEIRKAQSSDPFKPWNHSFDVKGGWGLGFELEVPYKKWFNHGLFISVYANSPKGGAGGVIHPLKMYKGGRFGTKIQYFTRFQYPFELGFLTINPNLKLGLGLGGGVENWERYENTNAGIMSAGLVFPLSLQGSFDFYFGKWFALTVGAQYTLEPGVDFLTSETIGLFNDPVEGNLEAGTFSLLNREFAITVGLKSTYL